VTWDYQSAASGDTDSYVRLDLPEQEADPNAGWSLGNRDRSAWAMRSNFPARVPFGVSPGGTLYQHEVVYGADGMPIPRFVRRAPAQFEDGDLLTTLTRIIIDGIYTDRFTVTLYGRLYPKQAEFVRGPKTLNARGYIDRTMKARQIGIQIESVSADFWRFGVISGDISSGTRR
jgi:hypothetical protein